MGCVWGVHAGNPSAQIFWQIKFSVERSFREAKLRGMEERLLNSFKFPMAFLSHQPTHSTCSILLLIQKKNELR